MTQKKCGKQEKRTGIVHSHGPYDVFYGEGSDIFSGEPGKEGGDIGYAERRGVDIYVSTPKGELLRFNVKEGVVVEIQTNRPYNTNDIPSDPGHPGRVNEAAEPPPVILPKN